jgi:hypothetical protein
VPDGDPFAFFQLQLRIIALSKGAPENQATSALDNAIIRPDRARV